MAEPPDWYAGALGVITFRAMRDRHQIGKSVLVIWCVYVWCNKTLITLIVIDAWREQERRMTAGGKVKKKDVGGKVKKKDVGGKVKTKDVGGK